MRTLWWCDLLGLFRASSLDGREVCGLHVDALHAFGLRLDGQRTAVGFLASGFGFHPNWIGTECGEGGESGFLAVVGEDVDELGAGAFVRVRRGPVGEVGHAVLGEELHGVIAEASVQGVELSGRRGVSAHFKHSWLAAFGNGQRRGIVRRRHEDRLRCLGEDFATLFAGLAGSLPFGICAEGFEAFLGGFAAFVFEHVDEGGLGTVLFIHRHPVADVFHAVLFKELAGVVAEAGEEGIQLAFVAGVDAEFVDRGGIRSMEGRGDETEESEEEEGEAGHGR